MWRWRVSNTLIWTFKRFTLVLFVTENTPLIVDTSFLTVLRCYIRSTKYSECENSSFQRLTAHFFKSQPWPIADEITGVVIWNSFSWRNLTVVTNSQSSFTTATRSLQFQIWKRPNQSDGSSEGGVYGHLIKFVRPVVQRQNSLQRNYVHFAEQLRLNIGKHCLVVFVSLFFYVW